MGDAIDNIKGVHGVGEKTAVKLIGQFGSVERLYENLPLVPGKLRETLATGRKDAFLSRELATLNRDVPLAFDLETARRSEPDWTKLRALWMELEFTRLLKDLPAPVAAVSGAPVAVLPNRGARAARAEARSLGGGGGRPPPRRGGGGGGAGAGWGRAPPGGGRPPPPPAVDDEELGRVLAERARWVHRYWEHVAAELRDKELWKVYEEIERPLVPVLARMERHGIRVDPARLEAFAKELERSLDNLTREIWQLAGEEFTIASPKQLAHILFEKLGLPALRRTKTGYSTDADVLTELALGHPLPAKILEHRTSSPSSCGGAR